MVKTLNEKKIMGIVRTSGLKRKAGMIKRVKPTAESE
jgi:hypothetical protein